MEIAESNICVGYMKEVETMETYGYERELCPKSWEELLAMVSRLQKENAELRAKLRSLFVKDC